MPRYRTIACDYCGHLLRKRDTECEICGRMTRRERARWIAKGAQLAVVLGIIGYIYLKVMVPH